MICPKCSSTMDVVDFEGYEIQKCSGCEGLWFENLEHELLKDIKGSETIDTGDAKDGALYDVMDSYDCPVCSSKMVKLVDKDQTHIWYEVCHSCFGVFFDAGEFRDYKDYTLFDVIGELFAQERL